jgi:hypothetical protein
MKIVRFALLTAVLAGLFVLNTSQSFAKGGGGGGGRSGGGGAGMARSGGGGGIRIGGGSGGIRIGIGSGSSSGSHCKTPICHPKPCPPSYYAPVGPLPGGPLVVAEEAVVPVGAVVELPGYWGRYDGNVILEFAGAQMPAKVVKWAETGVAVEMPPVKLVVPSPAKLLVVRWDKYVFPPMCIKLVPAVPAPAGGAALAGSPQGGAGAPAAVAGSGSPTGTGAPTGSVAGSGSAATEKVADKAAGGEAPAKADAAVASKPTAAEATGPAPTKNENDKGEPPGTFDEAIPDDIK